MIQWFSDHRVALVNLGSLGMTLTAAVAIFAAHGPFWALVWIVFFVVFGLGESLLAWWRDERVVREIRRNQERQK